MRKEIASGAVVAVVELTIGTALRLRPVDTLTVISVLGTIVGMYLGFNER